MKRDHRRAKKAVQKALNSQLLYVFLIFSDSLGLRAQSSSPPNHFFQSSLQKKRKEKPMNTGTSTEEI